jgi:hypothetical protein
MHKIETPFGYLCLPDERMAENAQTMYNSMRETKDLHVITVKLESRYVVDTPFGRAYTNRYDVVLNIERSVIRLRSQNFK